MAGEDGEHERGEEANRGECGKGASDNHSGGVAAWPAPCFRSGLIGSQSGVVHG